MKKKIIIISILGLVLIIGIVLFLLIFFEVIYNPFVNNRDLECSRKNVNDEEIFYFEFDWIGKVEKAEKKDYVYFETSEKAKEYYDFYIKQDFDNIELEEKTVVFTYDIFKNQIEEGSSRKQLLHNYVDFGFNCK